MRKGYRFVLCLLVFGTLATFGTAWGETAKPETPAVVDGVKTVTAEEVETAAADGALIIDVRPQKAYDKARLPGASLLVYDENSPKAAEFDASQDAFALDQLPADKGAKIVFYCNGETCWRSYKASVMASRAGYKNILFFRGGLPEWQAQGKPVAK